VTSAIRKRLSDHQVTERWLPELGFFAFSLRAVPWITEYSLYGPWIFKRYSPTRLLARVLQVRPYTCLVPSTSSQAAAWRLASFFSRRSLPTAGRHWVLASSRCPWHVRLFHCAPQVLFLPALLVSVASTDRRVLYIALVVTSFAIHNGNATYNSATCIRRVHTGFLDYAGGLLGR
jgi:hypothetical protein